MEFMVLISSVLRRLWTVCCWADMELFTSLNLTVRGFVVVTIITFQILHADTQMKCLGWKWKLFKYKLFLQGQWNCRICNNSDTAMGDIRCLLCSSVAPSVSVGYGHHWYVWYLSRRIVISTVIVSSYQGCTSFSLIREPIKKWPGPDLWNNIKRQYGC